MLTLENISKNFPAVQALQNVSLQFLPGQVHALCGENGAGKSTLMHIITGNIQPDAGVIKWNGHAVTFHTVQAAQDRGISIVYQERSLIDSLNVAENIFLAHPPRNAWGLIDHQAMISKTQQLLDELQLSDLSPQALTGKLSAAQKGMLEIAKALARLPSLLILDEPTASITHKETETLFRVIRLLKSKNVAIVYISHRMAEIKAISDVVSVLKDGKYQGTVPADTPTAQIVRMMVGRDLELAHYRSDATASLKLEAKALSGKGFRDVSFQLHKGEILGFAGLSGSGRSELAKAIFGDGRILSGVLEIGGKKVLFSHPGQSMCAGIAYLPEERKSEGLFMEKSVAENIGSARLQRGFFDERAMAKNAGRLAEKFGIRTRSPKTVVRTLSGGNQQKVVLAKWLSTDPGILIINEPTNGVDVGAKAEIYRILKDLTGAGKSILLISSELQELLLLADRVAVMYNGQITKIIDHTDASEDLITALASGAETDQN